MNNRFLKDESGASLTEFLIIIPLLITMTFSVIDMGVLMWQWNQAAKATQVGARMAVTRDPVATGVNVVTNPSDTANSGKPCIGDDGTLNAICPVNDAICSNTSCGEDFAFDSDAFTTVYDSMHELVPWLQPANVEIRYSTVGLGFVDQPQGVPVAVTVRITCGAIPLIILDAFIGPPDGCPDAEGSFVPPFATTLVGEDLAG